MKILTMLQWINNLESSEIITKYNCVLPTIHYVLYLVESSDLCDICKDKQKLGYKDNKDFHRYVHFLHELESLEKLETKNKLEQDLIKRFSNIPEGLKIWEDLNNKNRFLFNKF